MEIKKLNIFFPFFIFGYIFLNLAIALVEKALISAGVIGGVTTVGLFIQNELVIIGLVIIYALVTKTEFERFRIKAISVKEILLSLLCGYLIIPMSLFFNNLMTIFVDNAAEKTVGTVISYPFIVQIILIAVLPALVEEITFRGLFYGTYRKTGKIVAAMILSAVLFGLFHLNLDQFVYATFMGIVLARLTEATGSIISSMCAHFAFNTFSVTLSYIATHNADFVAGQAESAAAKVELPTLIGTLIFLLIIGLIFLMIALKIMKHMEKSRKARLCTNVEDNKELNMENVMTNEENSREELNMADSNLVTKTNEKLVTFPLILGIILCLAYIIGQIIIPLL